MACLPVATSLSSAVEETCSCHDPAQDGQAKPENMLAREMVPCLDTSIQRYLHINGSN